MERIGVIGGLGTLSGGDLFFKLLKNPQVLKNQLNYNFIFEQQPYTQMNLPLHQEDDIKSRKYYTYNICKSFEGKSVTKVLLPCFASHSFLGELQKEISIPILNIFDSLLEHIDLSFDKTIKIGVLTSDFVKNSGMIKRFFHDYELVYPTNQEQLMEAIYGVHGLKNGYLDGLSVEYICESCAELMDAGCDLILPAITEVSLIIDQLRKRALPVLDVTQIYADYALRDKDTVVEKPFKLGILGGVGPSATVDFMNKVIMNTPAKKDQDHIKMVVEQNPQIPDRTANLVRQETDPTIAMFSTCKRLEAEGADAIAIPCNTAHAFVQSIQQHLTIPIINMLTVTAQYISERYGKAIKVGLLATSGTLQSKVYHDALMAFGFTIIEPSPEFQDYVMESIYGETGVKAGFRDGICKEQITRAAVYIVGEGADVVILGCTELPLMFSEETDIVVNQRIIPLVDPTLVLAKRIVNLAKPTLS